MAADSVRVWIGSRLLPESDGRVSAVDHGITVGDGVFETCKVTDGVPFALSRHLDRLARSAEMLELDLPAFAEIRRRVIDFVVEHTVIARGRLRITLTSGPGPFASTRGQGGPTLIVGLAPAPPWPATISAVTVPWARNERSPIVGAKTTSYAENVVALRFAEKRGAQEAVFTNTQGSVCEGTGSNIVVQRGGTLVTPPLSSGCLAGITRELLLEWADAEHVPIVEDDVTPTDLATAPEVLLTSSTRDVQRVNSMDGRTVPGSELGKAAQEVFARRAAESSDP